MIVVTKVNNKPEWTVTIEKKVVGKIVNEGFIYCYYPKGSKKGGEPFVTLNGCIKSLEGE